VIRSKGIRDSREIARIELALLHGATVNTIPTLFWTVAHTFARADLVACLRAEILPLVSFLPRGGAAEEGIEAQAQAPTQAQISLKDLETTCPLLLSTYREVIRLSNQAMSTRQVMETTTMTDGGGRTYFLRAGSSVVMPATGHMEGDVWGANKNDFDPERFLDWGDHKASRDRHLVYMPFGGGRHLRPGRNLAKAEILGIVAMLLLSFEWRMARAPPSNSSQ
jgi:cytochrome P450